MTDFRALIIIMNVMLHIVVIKPVAKLSRNADAISTGNLNVDELIEKLDFTFKVDIKSNKYIPKFSIEVKMMYIAKLGYLSTRCLSSKTGNIPRCNCSNRYAIQ